MLELLHDAILNMCHVASEEHHALAFIGDFVLGQHLVRDANHAGVDHVSVFSYHALLSQNFTVDESLQFQRLENVTEDFGIYLSDPFD